MLFFLMLILMVLSYTRFVKRARYLRCAAT